MLSAIRKVQRAADRGGKPQDEQQMRDVWADILKAMQRARNGAKKGDQGTVRFFRIFFPEISVTKFLCS